MNPARTAIDKLGGTRLVARLLKRPPTTVQTWKDTGVIPARTIPKVLALAREIGIEMTADELLPPPSQDAA